MHFHNGIGADNATAAHRIAKMFASRGITSKATAINWFKNVATAGQRDAFFAEYIVLAATQYFGDKDRDPADVANDGF